MQRCKEPSTCICCTSNKGTLHQWGRSRAIAAGNTASKSRVAENVALIIKSGFISFFASNSSNNSLTASRIAATEFSLAVVAPRIPRTCHSTQISSILVSCQLSAVSCQFSLVSCQLRLAICYLQLPSTTYQLPLPTNYCQVPTD